MIEGSLRYWRAMERKDVPSAWDMLLAEPSAVDLFETQRYFELLDYSLVGEPELLSLEGDVARLLVHVQLEARVALPGHPPPEQPVPCVETWRHVDGSWKRGTLQELREADPALIARLAERKKEDLR